MNIMHIIPGDLWAGAECQVFYMLKELNKKLGHDICATVFHEGELFSRLSREGIKTHVINENIYNGVQIAKRLKELIETNNPCIVHAHEYKSHILATIALRFTGKRRPIIRTVHGLTYAPYSVQYLRSLIVFQIENYILRNNTDCIVAVSRTIEDVFKKRYPKAKISNINNSIDCPLPVPRSSEEVRGEFNISADTFWIGTTARLVPVKNIEMLINAAGILSAALGADKLKVSVFGDGPLAKSLQEKINQLELGDVVELHGHYKDILPVIKALDAFVLTSQHEGLPMSLLEAMAIGTVPVCTRVGGMQEVIEHGKSGFLVGLNNTGELAETLLSLYHDGKQKNIMGDNSRQRIRDNYSVEKSVDILESLYESIGDD